MSEVNEVGERCEWGVREIKECQDVHVMIVMIHFTCCLHCNSYLPFFTTSPHPCVLVFLISIFEASNLLRSEILKKERIPKMVMLRFGPAHARSNCNLPEREQAMNDNLEPIILYAILQVLP